MSSEKKHHVWWLSLQNVDKPDTKATPLEALALLEQMPRRTLTPRRDMRNDSAGVFFGAGEFTHIGDVGVYRDMVYK